MTECCAFLEKNQITETSNEIEIVKLHRKQIELIKIEKAIIKMCILFSNLVYYNH